MNLEVIRAVAEKKRVSLDKVLRLLDYLEKNCREDSLDMLKCTSAEIARAIQLNRSAVWTILKELEQIGIVKTRYVLVETGEVGRTIRRAKIYLFSGQPRSA